MFTLFASQKRLLEVAQNARCYTHCSELPSQKTLPRQHLQKVISIYSTSKTPPQLSNTALENPLRDLQMLPQYMLHQMPRAGRTLSCLQNILCAVINFLVPKKVMSHFPKLDFKAYEEVLAFNGEYQL